jgi:hypothetical protein
LMCAAALLGAVSGLLLALAALFVAHWVSGGRGFMATLDATILFGLGSILMAVYGAVKGTSGGAAVWEWLHKGRKGDADGSAVHE